MVQSGRGRTEGSLASHVIFCFRIARCYVISITFLLITKHPVNFATDSLDQWDPEDNMGYGQPPVMAIENDILQSEDEAKADDQWLSFIIFYS